jgi:DNA-binding transcriptional LysR family regulator
LKPRRRQSRAAPSHHTRRQPQICAAAARPGSTTAAARDIALSQSATSAALNELEALLGGRLFSRVGRRLVLNEHGRSMLPQARGVLDAAQGIESRFGSAGRDSAPQLRIAASTTIGNYLLPRLIAAYRRKERQGHFFLEIGNTRRVARAVADFEADVGFIEGPTTEPQLRVIPWTTDEMVVVCAPGHPLARAARARGARRAAKATAEQLGAATWLLREQGSGTREVVAAALLPHLHQLVTEVELGSAEAIKQAAAEGLGLTCLSRLAVQDQVDLGTLVVLPTALPPMRRTLYLVHHEKRYLTPTLERFIAFCRTTYRRAR